MKMYFPATTLLALLSVAYAQNANPFKVPPAGLTATGGKPCSLEWEPTTEGTVTLILRSGKSKHLDEGTIIASNLPNTGTYTWTPSPSLTRGRHYVIEIVDDANPDKEENCNYTPYITLDTETTEAQTTSRITLGAPSSRIDGSSAGMTGSANATSSKERVETKLETDSGSASQRTTTSHSHHGHHPHTTGMHNSSSVPPALGGAPAGRATAVAVGIVGVALGALAL